MADEIKAALTPDEWAARRARWVPVMPGGLVEVVCGDLDLLGMRSNTGEIVSAIGRERHVLAALALHDQPFGFAWADVDAIGMAADAFRSRARHLLHRSQLQALTRDESDYIGEIESQVEALVSAAARIAALLPPRVQVTPGQLAGPWPGDGPCPAPLPPPHRPVVNFFRAPPHAP